ncbi:hypothetical protein V501_10181 [Pseudogymnoascus sp. VKM F-4519 (FW-2642)]|nr:hypothetical protein V501_10181 [Pseudogymnoascus sp. VKM F-4519 (FW-2642)]
MTVLTGRPLSWAITATAGCGFLLFGYDQGVMSGLLSGAAFIKQFPEIDTTPSGTGSSSLQGTVVAIYEIASAYTIPHMIVGRIVAGLGNGMNTSTIPVWHSELMQAKKRGKGLAIELAINIFGVMTAYWVDYGFSYVNSGAQFRVPLALQIVFAVVTFAGILFLPESPRWLIAHERHSEARHILWALEMDPNSITESDPAINRQISEIQNAVNEERAATEGRSKTALLKNGPQKFRHRVLLGIGGQFMQQLSGINLITYYAPVIFENSVKLSHNLALLLAGFNGVAYFFSSLIPIWIIDRLGRRKLMLFAAAGQCACMAILAGTVSSGTKAGGVVAIVMLFLFNFFFAVGLLAIPWLLPAEYAPLAIRTRAASLATASNWIFTFLVVEITPVSINSIGWKTYIYFAVFNFFFIPLIWFFYPETQNLSLEQIDKLFTGEKVIIHWHPSMGSIAGAEHSPEAGSTDGDKISEQENCRLGPNQPRKELCHKVEVPFGVVQISQGAQEPAASTVADDTKNIPDIMPEISKAKQNNAPSKDQDQDTPQISEYMASIDRAHSSTSQHSFHRSPYNNISFAICEDGYMPMDTMSDSELPPNHEHATIHGSTPQSQPMYNDIQHNNLPEADPIFHTGEVAAELLALRYTRHPDSQQDQEPLPINIRQPENDNMHPPARQRIFNEPSFDNQLFDSSQGIFLPGSAYRELHTTLRNHIIHTARSNAPTRSGTPESQPNLGPFPQETVRPQGDSLPNDNCLSYSETHKPPELTPHREYILWKNYIDELAPWLDKFDNQRHFEFKLPIMAKSSPQLKYSILALSARQLERKNPLLPSSESLALYQEAIHLLLPELHTKNTEVMASCVILCVLEMMSCSPKEWRRHLDGCANLIEAIRIHGFVGEVEQALFWCFARMDVCGGLISQEETLIPLNRWTSGRDAWEDHNLFRNPSNTFDVWANYSVFICASVLHLLNSNRTSQFDISRPQNQQDGYAIRWQKLYDILQSWYTDRPEEMKPLLAIPVVAEDFQNPFPTVLYGNGSAISGNQLYHTSTLMMLQVKPKGTNLGKQSRSILWHARQICAISESNTHHGSWTNSVQPLWIAGKVMSHPSEHSAILRILERIEKETGWDTKWRVDDLKEYWGDLDD